MTARYDEDILYSFDNEAFVEAETGRPYTGKAVEIGKSGRVVAEDDLQDGVLHGTSRHWYESGQLRKEGTYRHGAAEGEVRDWHENGLMARDALFEHGILTRETRWSATGAVERTYEMTPLDSQYTLLQKTRAKMAKAE